MVDVLFVDKDILRLSIHVYSARSGDFVYEVPLIELYENELDLNNGRFKHYIVGMPGNKVFLRYEQTDKNLKLWLTEMLEWIHENVKTGTWSFTGRMLDVHRPEFIFGFSNITEYFAFTMTFR